MWEILKYKSQLRSLGLGPVFPDLTRVDREAKAKHQHLITRLVGEGHKSRFERGHWILDGKIFKPSTS